MKTGVFSSFLTFLFLVSCQSGNGAISVDEFKTLMNNIADGWSTQNVELALSSFDNDAIYMEPPNVQYYRGHEQLKLYFGALAPENKMKFHNLWFDESTQTGAAEFTLSYGHEIADTGIAVVELKKGRIKFWREYPRKGPADFQKFIEIKEKNWEWHIGNYPEPKDTLGHDTTPLK